MNRSTPSLSANASTALVVLSILASLTFMHWARDFLIPIAIAVILSFATNPIVNRLTRLPLFPMPRALAALVVMLVLWFAGVALAWRMPEGIALMAQHVPEAAERIAQEVESSRRDGSSAWSSLRAAFAAIEHAARSADVTSAPVVTRSVVQAEPLSSQLRNYLMVGSAGILAWAGNLVIISFLTFFLLCSGEHLKRRWVRLAGRSLNRKKMTVRMLYEIGMQIQYALLIIAIGNLAFGIAVWATLAWFGVYNAGAWGIGAAVIHFVPYFGSTSIALTAAIATYLQLGDWTPALLVAGSILVASTLIGVGLTTWLQSRASKMDASIMFIGLLLMGWLWGIAGLLLATPIMAIIKVVCDRVERFKPISRLISAEPIKKTIQRLAVPAADEQITAEEDRELVSSEPVRPATTPAPAMSPVVEALGDSAAVITPIPLSRQLG